MTRICMTDSVNEAEPDFLTTFHDLNEFINSVKPSDALYNSTDTIDWILLFHSEHCVHCLHMLTIFKEFVETDISSISVNIRAGLVNCDIVSDICKEEEIDGVPTVQFYHNGIASVSALAASSRSVEGMREYCIEQHRSGLDLLYSSFENNVHDRESVAYINRLCQIHPLFCHLLHENVLNNTESVIELTNTTFPNVRISLVSISHI